MESHHGVMSKWMQTHVPGYDADRAPTVLMPREAHNATRGAFNTWRAEMRSRMGGTFDWSKVSQAEARNLAERLFDAAKVPVGVRQEYWRQFESFLEESRRLASNSFKGE